MRPFSRCSKNYEALSQTATCPIYYLLAFFTELEKKKIHKKLFINLFKLKPCVASVPHWLPTKIRTPKLTSVCKWKVLIDPLLLPVPLKENPSTKKPTSEKNKFLIKKKIRIRRAADLLYDSENQDGLPYWRPMSIWHVRRIKLQKSKAHPTRDGNRGTYSQGTSPSTVKLKHFLKLEFNTRWNLEYIQTIESLYCIFFHIWTLNIIFSLPP